MLSYSPWKVHLALTVCVGLLIAGCTTPLGTPLRVPTKKTPEVMGVDDKRRVIKVGAPYSYLEKPEIDWSNARSIAAELCKKRWGAEAAEPVGRTRQECLSELGSNCTRWAMIGDYRCVTP